MDKEELARWLNNLDCTMVEICESHPGNPSRNIRPVVRKDLIAALSPPNVAGEETYASWQQRRGMLADKVDWAIEEYRGFMLDDNYDAQGTLDRIIDGLRETRDVLATPAPTTEVRAEGEVERAVTSIIQDVCDLPGDDDPDGDDTLILTVDDLRVILERNIAALAIPAAKGGSDE